MTKTMRDFLHGIIVIEIDKLNDINQIRIAQFLIDESCNGSGEMSPRFRHGEMLHEMAYKLFNEQDLENFCVRCVGPDRFFRYGSRHGYESGLYPINWPVKILTLSEFIDFVYWNSTEESFNEFEFVFE